jgi:hypothetical protein
LCGYFKTTSSCPLNLPKRAAPAGVPANRRTPRPPNGVEQQPGRSPVTTAPTSTDTVGEGVYPFRRRPITPFEFDQDHPAHERVARRRDGRRASCVRGPARRRPSGAQGCREVAPAEASPPGSCQRGGGHRGQASPSEDRPHPLVKWKPSLLGAEHRRSRRLCHPRAISSGHKRYPAVNHGQSARFDQLGASC